MLWWVWNTLCIIALTSRTIITTQLCSLEQLTSTSNPKGIQRWASCFPSTTTQGATGFLCSISVCGRLKKRTGSGPNPLDDGSPGDSLILIPQTCFPPREGQNPACLRHSPQSFRIMPTFQPKGQMWEKVKSKWDTARLMPRGKEELVPYTSFLV